MCTPGSKEKKHQWNFSLNLPGQFWRLVVNWFDDFTKISAFGLVVIGFLSIIPGTSGYLKAYTSSLLGVTGAMLYQVGCGSAMFYAGSVGKIDQDGQKVKNPQEIKEIGEYEENEAINCAHGHARNRMGFTRNGEVKTIGGMYLLSSKDPAPENLARGDVLQAALTKSFYRIEDVVETGGGLERKERMFIVQPGECVVVQKQLDFAPIERRGATAIWLKVSTSACGVFN